MWNLFSILGNLLIDLISLPLWRLVTHVRLVCFIGNNQFIKILLFFRWSSFLLEEKAMVILFIALCGGNLTQTNV